MQVRCHLWIYCNQLFICPQQCKPLHFHLHFDQTLTCVRFPSYENPVITATSRDSIGDIHSLSQYLSELDAPKPTSLLRSLLGLARIPTERESWFQISRMWTEVDDVCENESFGESASSPSGVFSLDFSIRSRQMGISDASWSIHSIYSSFPDFMPNTIWAT